MNRKLLLISIVFIGFCFETVKAQTKVIPQEKSKMVTIQIEGDDVLLNGKPLEQGKSEGNIILRKKIILDGDESNGGLMLLPELENGSGGKKIWESMDSTTFLGVVTETAEKGVLIESIFPNSPAEKAGLKVGDILLKVNDNQIQSPEMLQQVIKACKPNETVQIRYMRDGKKQKTEATLQSQKEIKRKVMVFSGNSTIQDLNLDKLLENVEDKTIIIKDELMKEIEGTIDATKDMNVQIFPKRKSKLGLKIQDTENESGVRILEVAPESAAEKAGVKNNDIILEINGKTIKNTDDARYQLQETDVRNNYSMQIERDGKRMMLEVKIPKSLKTTDL
jgi:serine protease Do